MRKLLIPVIIAAIVIVILGGSYFAGKLSRIFVKEGGETLENITPPPTIALKEGEIVVLLLGYGGAGHEGGTLTDTIILTKLDTKNKKAALVSVPRDLLVGNEKINFAYTKGIDKAKNAVAAVTGINPGYFIAVDFNQFQKIIEIFGTVDVNVPRTFDDYFYPVRGKELDLCGKSPEEMQEVHQKYSGFELEKQFQCRYEHIHFDKGLTKMTGEAAVKFVRSRHSTESGGDFARSERQFAVLTGIKNKLLSLNIIPNGGKIIDRISALARTDLPPEKISEVLQAIGDTTTYSVKEIHLTEENFLKSGTGAGGQFILLPKAGSNNYEEIRAFIQGQI